MTTLRRVGFYSDLFYGDEDTPTLAGSVRSTGDAWEAEAVKYLSGGMRILFTFTVTRDELDPAHPVIDSLAVLTDGEWAWPSDLPHYLARYHLDLPPELVEAMRKRAWQAPADLELDDDELEL